MNFGIDTTHHCKFTVGRRKRGEVTKDFRNFDRDTQGFSPILIYVLSNSIISKLWPLDDDTVVHPGHGPTTTIGIEKSTNPYVGSSNPAFGKYH